MRRCPSRQSVFQDHSYIQVSSAREYPVVSDSLKCRAISLCADSGESLACTTLRPVSRAKSPRMLPVAAFRGFVAPFTARITAIAFFPSTTIDTEGPDVIKSISELKKG